MKTFRIWIRLLPLVACLSGLVGCTPPHPEQRPLVSGTIIRCVLGDKPVMRAGEIGSWSGQEFSEGTIAIYERFAVITKPDGSKICAPHDWFSVMTFK